MSLQRNSIVLMTMLIILFGALAVQAESVKMTTQGITDDEILLGTHLDLSGPVAAVGQNYQKAYQMKVDEINNKGGIHGRKIRLIAEDTGYDPKKAVLATQKLLTKDKVFALMGTFGTPTSLASRPLAIQKGIPMIFMATGNTTFHTPTHPLTFAYFLPDEIFMKAGLGYMLKQGTYKNVGILYQDDELGDATVEGAETVLKKQGMELTAKTGFKRGATDFSSQVRKLKAADVDLLILATALRETVGACKEVKKLGWDVPLLGAFPPYNLFTIALGKESVEGLMAVGQNMIPYQEDASPEVAAWIKTFTEEYKGMPGPSAIAAYNFISMCAMGLEKAGPELTMEKFIAAMESITYKDIFGTPATTLSSTNHLMAPEVFVAQVKNGRWVTISDWLGE